MRTLKLSLLAIVVAFVAFGCASKTKTVSSQPREVTSTTAPSVEPVRATAPPTRGLPSRCTSRDGLPDRICTPGATDPRVTQANIRSTICARGYTKTVRPPVSYTAPLKRTLMNAYGDTGPASVYELDHLIPLELGGAPRSRANLWPQPWTGTRGAHAKDAVENELRRRVCDGTLDLVLAQRRIATDWTTADR